MGGDSSKIWKFVNSNERMRDLKGKFENEDPNILKFKNERERERVNRYPMT